MSPREAIKAGSDSSDASAGLYAAFGAAIGLVLGFEANAVLWTFTGGLVGLLVGILVQKAG